VALTACSSYRRIQLSIVTQTFSFIPWPLVRERHLSTKFSANFFWIEGVSRGQRSGSPMVVNLSFLDGIYSSTIPKYYCSNIGNIRVEGLFW
jgi:hypothetical protein